MKKLLVIIPLAGFLTGCTTFNKQDACAAAQTAYGIYLAVINADGQPSDDQIVAANAAAVVLQQQCGWTAPVAQRGMKSVRLVDKYGVPVLRP